MAMVLTSADDFEAELIRRGCQKTEDKIENGHRWLDADGRSFIVPDPEVDMYGARRYPEWMFADLAKVINLLDEPSMN